MKKALLCTLASALLTGSAWAQSYELTVRVPDTEKTLLIYHNGSRQVDTLAVTQPGLYTTAGEAGGDIFIDVFTPDREKSVKAVLDGKVEVDLTAGTATGTPENEALTRCEKELAPLRQEMTVLLGRYNEACTNGTLTDSLQEAIVAQYYLYSDQFAEKAFACCEQNTSHLFPAIYLREIMHDVDREKILALADRHPAFLDQPILDRLRQAMEGWRKQAVGTPFTDLEMADSTGTMHKLSEYLGHGNYVLVDFWASWCAPCRAEMPEVKKLYDKYHAKGFDIVGLSFDKKKGDWTAAIARLGLPWHHLSDLKGWESIAARTYGIDSIPATLLIGPDGRIAAAGLRGEELAKKLAEIYGE